MGRSGKKGHARKGGLTRGAIGSSAPRARMPIGAYVNLRVGDGIPKSRRWLFGRHGITVYFHSEKWKTFWEMGVHSRPDRCRKISEPGGTALYESARQR